MAGVIRICGFKTFDGPGLFVLFNLVIKFARSVFEGALPLEVQDYGSWLDPPVFGSPEGAAGGPGYILVTVPPNLLGFMQLSTSKLPGWSHNYTSEYTHIRKLCRGGTGNVGSPWKHFSWVVTIAFSSG
jgi:hypothetical protein